MDPATLHQHQELAARVRELEEKVQTLEAKQKKDAQETSKTILELHGALQTEQVRCSVIWCSYMPPLHCWCIVLKVSSQFT